MHIQVTLEWLQQINSFHIHICICYCVHICSYVYTIKCVNSPSYYLVSVLVTIILSDLLINNVCIKYGLLVTCKPSYNFINRNQLEYNLTNYAGGPLATYVHMCNFILEHNNNHRV